MKLLYRIIQFQIPMILDYPHPISNRISMTKHIRSHMLDTPITKQILMQSLQVIRIMNLIILFNILQILIMISHQKIFIIHRMKNSKESHLLKPGNLLIGKPSNKFAVPQGSLTLNVASLGMSGVGQQPTLYIASNEDMSQQQVVSSPSHMT